MNAGASLGGAGTPAIPTPRMRQMGERAVLLDCGSLAAALAVFGALEAARATGALDVVDLVPAAETVLLVGGDATQAATLAARIPGLLASGAAREVVARPAREIVIPVTYDGEDLAEVAALAAMSVEQLVARHLAAGYTAAFTGFAPGFAYLLGDDPELRVPRRTTPRPRVPAGAVGLAGTFTGIYPRASPGGWQLIGHTTHPMWDLSLDPPAAIVPGCVVRFTAERPVARAADGRAADGRAARADTRVRAPGGPDALVHGAPTLRIIDAGLQTLLQDGGREGLASLGVSPSGAADTVALRCANRLVGNAELAPALELSYGGFAAEALQTTVLAIAGAPRSGVIRGPLGERPIASGTAFRLTAGEIIELAPPTRGLRTVLGLRGGVTAAGTLGSLSRDTLAGLGPDRLASGDTVAVGVAATAVGFPEPGPRALPAVGEETVIECVLGPRADWFGEPTIRAFSDTSWLVTPRSDRVGVRLSGDPLSRAVGYEGRELPSEGMVVGAVQVPPDGHPVLFLSDHPLTGGYPVIAVVRARSLATAAQLPPGARVRFTFPTDPGAGLAATTGHITVASKENQS